jgi:deoxyxylulose-5-phosphate synthase
MERAVLTISHVHSKDWRTEIVSFLHGKYPSDDEAYIKRMHARTRPYVIIEEELLKQGVCSPLLKFLSRAQGQELMKEIH